MYGFLNGPLIPVDSNIHDFMDNYEWLDRSIRPTGHVNRSIMNKSILESKGCDSIDSASIMTNKLKLNPIHQLAILLKKARTEPPIRNQDG